MRTKYYNYKVTIDNKVKLIKTFEPINYKKTCAYFYNTTKANRVYIDYISVTFE